MKKLLAIAVMMLMFITSADAQLKFGVKGGVNLTNMSLTSEFLSSSNRTGFFVGPTVKFTLPIVGLGCDISALYDHREAKLSMSSEGTETDAVMKTNNLSIPINVRYNILGLGQMAALYLYAGPQFDFNIGDKGVDFESYKAWTLRSSNFSANVGLGVMLSGHFQVNANYNIAIGKTGDQNAADLLGTVGTNLPKAIFGSTKANAWQVGVAYYF